MYMKMKFRTNVIEIFFPSVLSMAILYIMVIFIRQEGGPSITVLYFISLFIAGGYFFLSAVIMYVVRLLGKTVYNKRMSIDDLNLEIRTLKNLKKNLERKYYLRKIDEETFKEEMRKIEEKIAYYKEKIKSLKGEKR